MKKDRIKILGVLLVYLAIVGCENIKILLHNKVNSLNYVSKRVVINRGTNIILIVTSLIVIRIRLNRAIRQTWDKLVMKSSTVYLKILMISLKRGSKKINRKSIKKSVIASIGMNRITKLQRIRIWRWTLIRTSKLWLVMIIGK